MNKNVKIISGFQSTGKNNLHLGNYIGAIFPLINLNKENIFCLISDLHAITTFSNNLYENSKDMCKLLLAFGFHNIYLQSEISLTTQGFWILSQFTNCGEMNRMTQFKEKKEILSNHIGLYTYPILMAADILFPQFNFVSVGEDQLQHLEITRKIGKRFNNKFKKDIFLLPCPFLSKTLRIKDLFDSNKKMSKSSPKGCIFFKDSFEEIRFKIKKSQTDNYYFPKSLEELSNRLIVDNYLNIYTSISTFSKENLLDKFKNCSWQSFKEEFLKDLWNFILSINLKYESISSEKILSTFSNTKIKINNEFQNTYNLCSNFFF